MFTEAQTAVIDFLASPSTHGGAAVERIDTHTAIVFLAGTRAWKLKRAVRFDYLDFSTEPRRKAMCEAEVRLNRRTAPQLYCGVVAVTRAADGSLALGGPGTPVDWVVEMQRFDQALLLDRLAQAGGLALAVIPPLASAIARFHLAAEPRPGHGGAAGMDWVIKGNADGLVRFGKDILDPAATRHAVDNARDALRRHRSLLDARRAQGFVRQCHGDLHLGNIVMLDHQPTPFDAVEFNDEIACIDVMYDIAFLLMDLWRRQLPSHANVLWNAYVAETDDWQALALLPLFLSCRAAVRAKTSATAAAVQHEPVTAGELRRAAREYLTLATTLLHPPQPCVVAIGGFSGSGKSTLARALAPALGAAPGALVLRSDEIRKRLRGVGPLDRLGPDAYTADVSRDVYALASQRAGALVGSGHSVIVDAVFADPRERAAIERVAASASVPFVGIWLDAPAPVLTARARTRRRDASDATAEVVLKQVGHGAGAVGWQRIDAAEPAEHVLRAVLSLLPKATSSAGT